MFQVHLSCLFLGLSLPYLVCFILQFTDWCPEQRHIQILVQHARWSFLRKDYRLKVVNYFHTKIFILDVWQGYKHASAENQVNCWSRFTIC